MNAFQLKVVACLFMVVDHVAKFLPNMPVWFHWIGRGAAPIFIVLCGWSCMLTHNFRRYLFRLYSASILMAILQCIFGIENNIFRTLFQIALIIRLLSAPSPRRRATGMIAYVVFQIASIVALRSLPNIPDELETILAAAFGSLYMVEGGIITVIFGVAAWALREHKIGLSLLLVLFPVAKSIIMASPWTNPLLMYCARGLTSLNMPIDVYHLIMVLSIEMGLPLMAMGASLFTINYYWASVLALPFILSYNGKRGPSCRWFFYVFYPAHIIVLHAIGQMMMLGTV